MNENLCIINCRCCKLCIFEDGIFLQNLVYFGGPGVLSRHILQSFTLPVQVIQAVSANPDVTSAVLISGKPGCWIAGADVKYVALLLLCLLLLSYGCNYWVFLCSGHLAKMQ